MPLKEEKIILTYKEWYELYKPTRDKPLKAINLDTTEIIAINHHVWTLVSLAYDYHIITSNNLYVTGILLGYFITFNPWKEGEVIQATWYEYE